MRKTFVEQNTFGPLDNQYKFNGKELDVETGLYYYGARFYDPRFSFWYGVDPLAEKFPGFSPFNYCLNNPVMLVDPDGMAAQDNDWHPDKNGNLVADTGDSTVSLAEYQGITYEQAAAQLKANGYKVNENGILNLNVGDVVDTGAINLDAVVIPLKEASIHKMLQTDLNEINEAKIAMQFKGDQRIYSMSNKIGTVDCSRFTREVAALAGYNLPRTAYEQARWYERNGIYSTNLIDAKAGDHIFWSRGKNAYHTGIVINVTKGEVVVIQAQVNSYKPGSIKTQKLMPNGEIRGFRQPFVAVGRFRKNKLKK